MVVVRVGGASHDVEAVLFDKDGTLLEFDALWVGWAERVITDLAGRSTVDATTMATTIGLDLERRTHVVDGPLAVGTEGDLAAVLAHPLYLAGWPWGAARAAVASALAAAAPALDTDADVRPLPGAVELVRRLSAAGARMGVVTSDDTARARDHVQRLGLDAELGVVVGADLATDGGKPAPGGVRLACEQLGVRPDTALLIGDSDGDLRAAAAAGLAAGIRLVEAGDGPQGPLQVSRLDQITVEPS